MTAQVTRLATPAVPVSWGELIDKLTILEIKQARIDRPAARDNIDREHRLLARVAAPALAIAGMDAELASLRRVNAALWDIEDAIREEERHARFDAEFVALARAVYHRNDERAAIKRRINDLLGSDLVEEKGYTDYASAGGLSLAGG